MEITMKLIITMLLKPFYAPSLHIHIYPHDFFTINIHDSTRYIGEYISCCNKRVHIRQQISMPSYDQLLVLFIIYTTHQQLSKNNNVEAHFLIVPLEDLSKCIGLQCVFQTNTYIWVQMK